MELESGALARAQVRPARTEADFAAVEALLGSARAKEIQDSHPEERGSVRMLEADGRLLAALVFAPVPVRLRGRPVRCARIVELPGEDGRPHFRATGDREPFDFLVEELLGYLWARGYPLACVHGELALYPPHGFAPCFYHPRVYVGVEEALRLPQPCRVRHLKSDDVRRILELKDLHSDQKPVLFASGVPRFHHFCVEDSRRRIRGCFALQVDGKSTSLPKVFVPEVECEDRAAAETILRHCAEKAKEVGEKEIHFTVAAAHPLARVCLEIGGRAALIGASTDPGKREAMLCLVERRALSEALELPQIPRKLEVKTERGRWTLAPVVGRTVILPGEGREEADLEMRDSDFTQLIAGYRAAEEIDSPVPEDARGILDRLFPKTWPYSLPDPDLWA